jgi:hypothetical protein
MVRISSSPFTEPHQGVPIHNSFPKDNFEVGPKFTRCDHSIEAFSVDQILQKLKIDVRLF